MKKKIAIALAVATLMTVGITATSQHLTRQSETSADMYLSAEWVKPISEAREKVGLSPVYTSEDAERLMYDDILGLQTTPLAKDMSKGTNGTNWRVVANVEELLGSDIAYDSKYNNGYIAVGQQTDGTYIVIFLEP